MRQWKAVALLITSTFGLGFSLAFGVNRAASAPLLEKTLTLPIVFNKTVSADRSHAGDIVMASTSQTVRLADDMLIPAGTKITGHVVAANGFIYNKAPYAEQKPAALTIQFDALLVGGGSLPLRVMVRAMADPLTSEEARRPVSNEVDSRGTMTQVGGDQVTPSEAEVVARDGSVVGYNRHGAVYAHLRANGRCDGSQIEVPVGIYSASACGLYGFVAVSAAEMGSVARPSVLTLVSDSISPRIWKNSTALLEVLPAR